MLTTNQSREVSKTGGSGRNLLHNEGGNCMTQENNGEKTAKSSRNGEIISPAPAVRSYKARLYVSDLYSGMVQGKNLYGTKKVGLPRRIF